MSSMPRLEAPSISPTSTEARVRQAATHSTGFLYLVSVTGITGERAHLPPDLEAFVRRVRKLVELPLAVGFGISRPQHARAVARLADGVIVGSALIRRAQEARARDEEAVVAVSELATALARAAHSEESA